MQPIVPQDTQQAQAVRQQFAQTLRKELNTKRILLTAAGLLGLVIALPVIIMAIQAGFALAAAVALGLLGYFAWRRIPLWVQRHENSLIEANQREMNRHLAALKSEAKANPIEQAQNEYLRREKQYQAFKTAMEQIGGKVQAFGSKLARTKQERPNYDMSQETAAHEKMQAFYDSRIERLKLAYQKLHAFHDKIEEARVKWDFQLAANDAIRAMNATDQEAKINEILTAVAFESVQEEFDAVFAKLDIDAVEMNTKNALEFGPGMTIDVSNIQIPEIIYAKS